ncbi:hypothetical protein BT96DRAFT_428841 [Gymnopus androsaceus JB14]|uniref:Uncharacterized protein n=1 Tax=Gymnopus androsaceus JB14 TaxID=1447944 RepID=A0A6A4GTC8_9AGAR|nr:hypothetical protein BT96DRAFT_428841 [Gymnopus androsaceus JB14]
MEKAVWIRYPYSPIVRAQLRCRREIDCGVDSVCTRPDSSSSILRLSVQGQEVILWSGPRNEIWEQVSVGRYVPRFWFIPLGRNTRSWGLLGISSNGHPFTLLFQSPAVAAFGWCSIPECFVGSSAATNGVNRGCGIWDIAERQYTMEATV